MEARLIREDIVSEEDQKRKIKAFLYYQIIEQNELYKSISSLIPSKRNSPTLNNAEIIESGIINIIKECAKKFFGTECPSIMIDLALKEIKVIINKHRSFNIERYNKVDSQKKLICEIIFQDFNLQHILSVFQFYMIGQPDFFKKFVCENYLRSQEILLKILYPVLDKDVSLWGEVKGVLEKSVLYKFTDEKAITLEKLRIKHEVLYLLNLGAPMSFVSPIKQLSRDKEIRIQSLKISILPKNDEESEQIIEKMEDVYKSKFEPWAKDLEQQVTKWAIKTERMVLGVAFFIVAIAIIINSGFGATGFLAEVLLLLAAATAVSSRQRVPRYDLFTRRKFETLLKEFKKTIEFSQVTNENSNEIVYTNMEKDIDTRYLTDLQNLLSLEGEEGQSPRSYLKINNELGGPSPSSKGKERAEEEIEEIKKTKKDEEIVFWADDKLNSKMGEFRNYEFRDGAKGYFWFAQETVREAITKTGKNETQTEQIMTRFNCAIDRVCESGTTNWHGLGRIIKRYINLGGKDYLVKFAGEITLESSLVRLLFGKLIENENVKNSEPAEKVKPDLQIACWVLPRGAHNTKTKQNIGNTTTPLMVKLPSTPSSSSEPSCSEDTGLEIKLRKP